MVVEDPTDDIGGGQLLNVVVWDSGEGVLIGSCPCFTLGLFREYSGFFRPQRALSHEGRVCWNYTYRLGVVIIAVKWGRVLD